MGAHYHEHISLGDFYNYRPCCLSPCWKDHSCTLCQWPLKKSDIVRHYTSCHVATCVLGLNNHSLGWTTFFYYAKTHRIYPSDKKFCAHPDYLNFEADIALAFSNLVSQFGTTFVGLF